MNSTASPTHTGSTSVESVHGRHQVEGFQIHDPYGPVLPAAVVAALLVPGVIHAVGDARAVRRDFALVAARQRQRRFHAALRGHRTPRPRNNFDIGALSDPYARP